MSETTRDRPARPALNDAHAAEGEYAYVGQELDLFADARRWKAYVRRQLLPYLGGRVVEVGAGHGGTTRLLCSGGESAWVCLEPDPALADRLRRRVIDGELPGNCAVVTGTLADRPAWETESGGEPFDAAVYIDVLEHIEDDRAEVARAADAVRPGGHLLALSPAHQKLYSPFDRAIGHFRRYSRRQFAALADPGQWEPVRLAYLDSVGLLASSANRWLLRSAMPDRRQVAVWDTLMVPLSRVLDPLTRHMLGKSVLGVWRRRG